jgi:hypothetical protein
MRWNVFPGERWQMPGVCNHRARGIPPHQSFAHGGENDRGTATLTYIMDKLRSGIWGATMSVEAGNEGQSSCSV